LVPSGRIAWWRACAAAAGLCLATAGPLRAQSLWELTPYRVLSAIAVEPAPQIGPAREADAIADLASRAGQVFGPTWRMETAPLVVSSGRQWTDRSIEAPFESLPESWQAYDKVYVLHVSVEQGETRVAARELDVATRRWGRPRTAQVLQPEMLADAMFRALFDSFSVLGRVEVVEGKVATVQLRAGGLPLRDPNVALVRPGTAFLPVIRTNDRTGAPRRIEPIEWTWLDTVSVSEAQAACNIYSGLRTPLRTARKGRVDQFVVSVDPPGGSTRVILHARTDPKRALAGYDVFAQAPGVETTTLLGRTDRFGGIEVSSAAEAIRVLLVRNGGEVLARLPLVPGLEAEARAPLTDDDVRLAVEGFIVGLQQSLVEAIARREVVLLRIRKRIEGKQWDEARALVEELKEMPTRAEFATLLANRRKSTVYNDPRVKREINQLFDDTQKLIDTYLDPKQISDIEADLNEAGAS
jgi:hypothetical protein